MNIMLRKCLLALTGLLLTSCICAQNGLLKYAGHINAGAPFGDNKTNIIIQTIHGARFKTWFVGMGGGLDGYYQQSLPVFLDIRKNVLSASSTPFFYADGGINFLAETDGPTLARGYTMKRKPGSYYDVGAGYRFGLETTAINFTVGYSYKGYKENNYGISYIPNMEPQEDVLLETKRFHLRRISFKIGFEF